TAAAAEPTTAAPDTTAATGGTRNGVTLPDDAAPPEQQVFVRYFDGSATFTSVDFMESVYNGGGNAFRDLLSDPLVRLNKDFDLMPGAATKWTSNAAGTEWTFELDPNLIWSDDTPVTADDYVATFRYAADPKHAWDFAWYYSAPGAIKNWDAVVAGTTPVEELGVRADGPNKVIFESEVPAPYLPAKLLYSTAFQKKALEAHGGTYNSEVSTSVSSGPFVLTEWTKGTRLVWEANPKYKGNNKPFIQKLINIAANTDTFFAAYQANEIDFVEGSYLTTADNEIISADPELQKDIRPNFDDFRTDYFFFDVSKAPFDNLKVRQAFSHMVDRDGLIQSIINPSQGIPAYSFLMPGFPASNSEGLKGIQNYDPAAAKALMAEAGYENGAGFPTLELWLRNETPVRQSLAESYAAALKQELGINVTVSNKEFKTFTDALNAKPTQIQFGMVSYGIDFLDPSNMLGVWLSGGRHSWSNPTFDKMVTDAAAFVGDDAARIQQFKDAEKILVEDVPAVWIYHRTRADLMRPYLKGGELEPDKTGNSSLHWPSYSGSSTSVSSIYISNDVTNYRTSVPQ
ncbi:MAG: peptide ABC transporter substrate-binding protein, partial [Chloroflexales bacterium]|nr:peptide ABC transporter substrate-binding protein [Chloroflexales bacterium]